MKGDPKKKTQLRLYRRRDLLIPTGNKNRFYQREECLKENRRRNDSTYYKCSNTDVGSTKQELIIIFEHKIYQFNTNLFNQQ